eukprot:5612883-Prymnesium_polylepis.2
MKKSSSPGAGKLEKDALMLRYVEIGCARRLSRVVTATACGADVDGYGFSEREMASEDRRSDNDRGRQKQRTSEVTDGEVAQRVER